MQKKNVLGQPKLRKRKYKIDYSKLNRGSSLSKEEIPVPVYKKPIREKIKPVKDIYDFDSDSEQKTKKKPKESMDTSVPFEKEMQKEMRRIQRCERKKQVRKRPKENVGQVKDVKQTMVNDASLDKQLKISPSDDLKMDGNYLGNVDSAPLELEICSDEKATSINVTDKREINDSRIHILQNITLNDNAEDIVDEGNTELYNEDIEDIFNVDSFNSSLFNSTPWRPDFHINRNPFFLQVKQSSLPSYNQDMVISAENLSVTNNKSPKDSTTSISKAKQTSIIPYVNGNSLLNSPSVIETSLFDSHELSPVKIRRKPISRSSSNKENSLNNSPIKHSVLGRTKRKILGEKVNNLANVLNSQNQLNNNEKEWSYFGFNDTFNSPSSEENHVGKQNEIRKPFRIDNFLKPTINDNNVKQMKQPEKVIEDKQIDETNEIEEIQNEHLAKIQNPNEELPTWGLFEDLEPGNINRNLRKYNRPDKNRARRISIIDIEEEKVAEHPRKRKKDMMSKKEMVEADKWAKKVNNIFHEIDNYSLEID